MEEVGLMGPGCFAFGVEGEVKATETDCRFDDAIGLTIGHLDLEGLHHKTHKSPTWHTNYRCFEPLSDK